MGLLSESLVAYVLKPSQVVNVKPRVCLKCDRTFDSQHNANRICPKCTAANSGVGVTGIPFNANPSGRRCVKGHNGEKVQR